MTQAIPDDRDGQPQPAQSPSTAIGHHQSRMPHPQTGVGIEVLELVAQVGGLVRQERKRIRSCRFVSMEDIAQARAAIQEAEVVHSKAPRHHATEIGYNS